MYCPVFFLPMKLGYTLVLRFRTYLPSRMNHRTTYQTKIIPLEPMVLIHRCVSRTIFGKYIQDTHIHDCSGRLKQSCLRQDKNLREWEKTSPSLEVRVASLSKSMDVRNSSDCWVSIFGSLSGVWFACHAKNRNRTLERTMEPWNPKTSLLGYKAGLLCNQKSLAKLSFGWLSSSTLSWPVPLPQWQRRELSPVPKPLFSARTFAACERSPLAALGRAQLVTSWCGCRPSNRTPGLKTSRIGGRSGDSGDGLKTLWFSTTERWSSRFASI